LLLMMANTMAHRHTGTLRLLLSGAVGAVHAGICMALGIADNPLWRLLVCGVMGWIAFEMDSGFLERFVLFTLLRFCVDGMASATGNGAELGWAVVLGGIFLYGMRNHIGFQQFVQVE
jgi:hypothetical protein